ncbi:protein downstream neighbor of son homolog isoform X2 [Condylostylus longicornis]|uniref:protein downstream neighbor of son homolog isoform X2 n=1 Tax=Condylostylus longicornis TaxID=2530218 RepID=UPI00244D9C56|nr:protein downstream neighbor of son homolog isoform X2 [Condylostylus longicornis]
MENANLSQTWKTPDEVLKLHRLKKKKDALAARVSNVKIEQDKDVIKEALLEAVVAQKRKNPFAKGNDHSRKIQKTISSDEILNSEDTIFQLINPTASFESNKDNTKGVKSSKPQPFDIKTFANLFNETVEPETDDNERSGERLPIDWGLKLRMRILCETDLPGSNLKSNQEASGITGFVRCINRKHDIENSSLDISLGARFHQGLHYWQHPTLPWLTLFPRNAKENSGFQIKEKERNFLTKDWSDSFRGVFQLLRARQCPYFYLCANQFTVLFRSAGIGGRAEMHAIMSPTTRGMRNALRQEEIEFSMPLKKDNNLNKSNEENSKISENSNNSNNQENQNDSTRNISSDDDMEEEKWLEDLGVGESEIRKINTVHVKRQFSKEVSDDFSDISAVLIEANVGRLAGIPPTLLSPVAFPKASMQSLTVRSSKVRNDGKEYFSAEIKGIILPSVLPYMTFLLSETKNAFSVTLTGPPSTLGLTKVAKKLIQEEGITVSDQVFGKENLSDCGLQEEILDLMCNVQSDSVSLIERICFSKGVGFIWS